VLQALHKRRALLGASAGMGGSDSEDRNGIVQRHAYTVLRVVPVQRFRFVQLRNPWGKFEWTGGWSDASDLWRQHPRVAPRRQGAQEGRGR